MNDLTKWPRLLVKGETITREQANEVLIRTCVPSYLDGNDRAWTDAIGRVMGMRLQDEHPTGEIATNTTLRMDWYRKQWKARDERAEALGVIPLEYLYNSRIASSWLGGPHGWCDWNGTIACWTHNIGKWPSYDEITEEWTSIAEAFPFLDLTAQLISNEGGYEIDGVDYPGELCGEWRVKDGAVTVDEEPTTRLYDDDTVRYDRFFGDNVRRILYDAYRERGVTLERLAEAVAQVEAKMKG